jgi:hypothetical protein
MSLDTRQRRAIIERMIVDLLAMFSGIAILLLIVRLGHIKKAH